MINLPTPVGGTSIEVVALALWWTSVATGQPVRIQFNDQTLTVVAYKTHRSHEQIVEEYQRDSRAAWDRYTEALSA